MTGSCGVNRRSRGGQPLHRGDEGALDPNLANDRSRLKILDKLSFMIAMF
jgi:hypothetical protein